LSGFIETIFKTCVPTFGLKCSFELNQANLLRTTEASFQGTRSPSCKEDFIAFDIFPRLFHLQKMLLIKVTYKSLQTRFSF
jgi:hypothetical protein